LGAPSMKPRTSVREFIENWDLKIIKIASSYGMADFVDDIKQEIFLEIIKIKEGKNGLERYDPTRAAFSTYVYQLILTKIRNYRAKVQRQHKWEVGECSLKPTGDSNTVYWERGETETQENIEFWLQLKNVKTQLKHYKERSCIWREGECISRDLHTLFELVQKDFSRKEIKEYFEYSTGSVGAMFDLLRQVPELLELLNKNESEQEGDK